MIAAAMRPYAVLLLSCCAAAAVPAPAAAAQEEVVSTRFDLLGWHRAGAAAVELVPPEPPADVLALLDGDPSTTLQLAGDGRRTLVLRFDPPQPVERIELETAGVAACDVRLTVVRGDGGRFQAGRIEVSGGQSATFALREVAVRALHVEVEALEEGGGIALAGLAVHGSLRIDALALEEVPPALPEGGSFGFRVAGIDRFGGRPDLTEHAQILVQPARALAFLPGRRATARIVGTLTLEPRLGALAGPPRSVLVTPVAPPPPAPEALPGMQVVTLRLEGEAPFEIFRRHAGEKLERSLGRAERNVYYDDSVLPGTAYTYSARRVDRLDNPLTDRSESTRVRTWTRCPPEWSAPGRVPLLLVIFVDSLAPGEDEALVESAEAARLFAYRHTGGRVVLDPVVLRLSGPTPPTTGPTMLGIEARLRREGLRDDRFGFVFAVANDLAGDYGGFPILGRGIGAMGRGLGAAAPAPPGALGPEPGFAFVLLHELQHAAARLVEPLSPSAPHPSGHLDEDFGPLGALGAWRGRPFDVGDAWDAQARLLAEFAGLDTAGPPWRRPLEVLDTDADGLADDDPRLPIDERRLGSDPSRADSDGDGLSDMEELRAGLYGGSDPLDPDSDGDGTADGLDRWPLSDFTGVVVRGATPRALASTPGVLLRAAWQPHELLLEIVTDAPCDAFLDLDGSGELGRWESDADTGGVGAPASDVYAGPARIALRAHAEPRGVFVGRKLVPGARLSAEPAAEGGVLLRVALPAAMGPGARDAAVPPGARRTAGLRLRAGSVLGLALTLRPSGEGDPAPFDPWPEDGAWLSLFEPHRLYDARLAD